MSKHIFSTMLLSLVFVASGLSAQGVQSKWSDTQLEQKASSISTSTQLSPYIEDLSGTPQLSVLINNVPPEYLMQILPNLKPEQQNQVVRNMNLAQIQMGLDNQPNMGAIIASAFQINNYQRDNQQPLQEILNGLTTQPFSDPNAAFNLVSNFSQTQYNTIIPSLPNAQLAVLSPMITTLSQLKPFLETNLSSSQLKSLVGNIPQQNLGPIIIAAAANPSLLKRIIPNITSDQKTWMVNNVEGVSDIINNHQALVGASAAIDKREEGLSRKDLVPATRGLESFMGSEGVP